MKTRYRPRHRISRASVQWTIARRHRTSTRPVPRLKHIDAVNAWFADMNEQIL